MVISVTAPASRPHAAEIDLAAKVAFLSNPADYPEATSHVDAIQTHLSWVFLTDRHAYKIKKPVRNASIDLRTLAARQFNCAEELRLNRRLSPGIYLATIPLYCDRQGAMSFDETGTLVDWLVKMKRLPGERMLDRLISQRSIRKSDIDALVRRLWSFYRSSPRPDVIASEYRLQLQEDIITTRSELREASDGLGGALADRISTVQLVMLSNCAALFDARVSAARIVEGHGDLRPEHICLEAQPEIIDCLEFSRVLRTLDVADELGYLALECERLGAPELRSQLFDSYREASGDSPPDGLVHFYQSQRACVRAMLALRHLREPGLADRAEWRSRAAAYFTLARAHAQHCR